MISTPPNSNSPVHEKLTPLPTGAAILMRQRRYTRSRHLTGLWLGLVMGAGYFTCTQVINSLLLPDIPIYQIPPGMPWTMLIAGAACALLGLATAWSDNPLVGVLWGSIIGTAIFDSYAVANSINDKVPLSGGNESIAIARFNNNYMLIRLYANADAPPECVSRTSAP